MKNLTKLLSCKAKYLLILSTGAAFLNIVNINNANADTSKDGYAIIASPNIIVKNKELKQIGLGFLKEKTNLYCK